MRTLTWQRPRTGRWLGALAGALLLLAGCGTAAVPPAAAPPGTSGASGSPSPAAWTHVVGNLDGPINVTALTEGPTGTLYVGTAGQGVLTVSHGHWRGLGPQVDLVSRTIRSLAILGPGRVVAGTSQGAFEYQDGRWTALVGSSPGPGVVLAYGDIPVYSVVALVSPHGHITVGGYPPGNVSVNSASDGFGGVWQYRHGQWVALGHLGHTPTSMVYMPSGALVVGTHQGVWTYTRAGGWHALGAFPVSAVVVTALAATVGGHVLAAVSESAGTVYGLDEYVGGYWASRTSYWSQFPSPPRIQALAVNRRTGVVAVGTAASGVWEDNGNTWSQAGPQRSLMVTSSVQALYVARDGTIWAGTPAGLWRLPPP